MKNLIIFALLVCSVSLYAQDAIYKKDKTKLEGKVTEVGEWTVKYKPSSNPDGPLYSVLKTDIAIIIYQNGTSDIFSNASAPRVKKFDSLSVNFCRNFIGTDIGEFSNTAVNMTYEHVFGKKGNVALRIPFSVGLTSDYYYGRNKIFSTGADFLFFPTGQGKLRYFTAPYVEFGMYHNNYYYFQTYSYGQERFMSPYYGTNQLEGGVKNGFQYQPTRHFSISADLGFGIRGNMSRYTYTRPGARANLILGYRF